MEINVLQILFQVINFGVVFVALTYLLTKPITKMLDDRSKKTDDAMKAAEETLRERETIENVKKKTKLQAERDAEKLLEETRSEAKVLKTKLSKDVKEEIMALKAKELEKIESEKKARMEEMEKQVSKLSIEIAAKVIGSEVSEKTHKSLISASLKDIAKAL